MNLLKLVSLRTALLIAGEALAHQLNPFCINLPLFVVNNAKLAGLILSALLGVIS